MKELPLIAHDIDVAPRIDSLLEGDLVRWTRHDPPGQHVAGWVKHDRRTYQ